MKYGHRVPIPNFIYVHSPSKVVCLQWFLSFGFGLLRHFYTIITQFWLSASYLGTFLADRTLNSPQARMPAGWDA